MKNFLSRLNECICSSNKNTTNNENPLEYLSKDKKIKAYEFARDTRKFEIELYWKRATYFWTFLALAFGGYFTALEKLSPKYQFIISLVGVTFSLSWYLVNRASKYWQENWETHIYYLEDEITGPIYKTPSQ